MRTLLYLLTALTVMVLAFWAYRENYRTQAALDDMEGVQTEIAGLSEKLGLLRAEWAYLNRPERLAHLVALNADKLQLAPLSANQFVGPHQLAFPAPKPPEAAPAPSDPLYTGPSQNPGAPPRRPAISAAPMSPDAPTPESQP